jgi:hypothetical protein
MIIKAGCKKSLIDPFMWNAIIKLKEKNKPIRVQTIPNIKLCLKFSLKRVRNIFVRPGSSFFSQLLTTPNMAAVAGKIVKTGKQNKTQRKFRNRNSHILSRKRYSRLSKLKMFIPFLL